MATRRWGITKGQQHTDVTEGDGIPTVSDHVELTIDLAPGLTREEALLALDKIKKHIIQGPWPPALAT